jgi:hypothetical protein
MAGMQPPPLPALNCQRCDKLVAIVATAWLAISLAANDLRAQRGISPAVFVEAMIGVAVLNGGGFTHEGKPFNFSAENARLLLSRSLEIRDFISEKAMELDNQARQAPSSAGAEFISPEELASRPALLSAI